MNMIMAGASGGTIAILIAVWAQVCTTKSNWFHTEVGVFPRNEMVTYRGRDV